MIETEIVFVDWAPINSKSDIRGGGHIRRYYAWITLNKMVDTVLPFREKSGNINWKAVRHMFKKDSKIWVEYGCGGVAHLFALFASFIRSKKLIINVHDLAIQQKYVDKSPSFLKKIRLQLVERLLLKRASTIILVCPGLLDYFKPEKNQKIVIMPPGVGEDELFMYPSDKIDKKNKIALYFGSMRRQGAILSTMELFSKLKGWKLHLIGLEEGEEILERKNVKYLGSVSHDKLAEILSGADAILIPYPKNDYLDKSMPIKLGYAFKSCKPVITTILRGVSKYISTVGLEDNVIYVEEWNLSSLKEALDKAQNLNIDADKTIEKLKPMTWEPRFETAVEIALGTSRKTHDRMEWI